MDPRGPAADEIREVAEHSRGMLDRLRGELSTAEEDRRCRVEQIGEEATKLVESLASQIANELANDIAHQHDEAASQGRQQLEADRATLESDRQAWIDERTQWESVRDQVEADLADQEARLTEQAQRWESEQGAQATEALAALEQQLQEANEAREASERFAAELRQALDEANEQLTAAAEAAVEQATLQEKFDLALADLQTHKEHVAALEQELADRPTITGDPVEADALRDECNELRRQIDEATADQTPVDASEEMEHLRARFEMAVDEVRQLKTENAALQDQVATIEPASDAPENDWEAQKRRLLLSLEGEGQSEDEARDEERATIAGTIQITDQVVEEKDREIERLRASLGAASDGSAVAATEDLLDHDDTVRVERERLAALEAEWQEKLRAAELELSVERAKISRTQSELDEQKIELETLRAAVGQASGPPGEAKHRWLNKLGLGTDDGK